jgi:hypothetical protein
VSPEALEGEAPPRIDVGRAVIRSAVALVIAGGICAWAARGISHAELREGIHGIPLWPLLASLGFFTVSFFTADVLGFGLSWRAHLAPEMEWKDVRALVCGKQVLALALPVLTKVVGPLYFWRRWKISPARALGASELVNTCDLTTVVLFTSVTLLVSDVELGTGLTVVVAAWWVLALAGGVWLWSPRLRNLWPRARSAALLQAFTTTTRAELAKLMALRVAHQLVLLTCVRALLAGMGATLSPSQLAAFGPLFIFSGALPISLAGFGGPQGLAVALLAYRWRLMAPGQAMAFSLVWSSGFLVLQTAVAVAHFPRMLTLLRAKPHG